MDRFAGCAGARYARSLPHAKRERNRMRAIRITEENSGLDATAHLLADAAPAHAAVRWEILAEPRDIPALHAIWTGPEISAPIPDSMLADAHRAAGLPLENATVLPQPGELVLTWLAARIWGGGEAPVFDLGLFYGPHGRMFFPIGWHAGSVVARVAAADLPPVAEACRRIRRTGACTLRFSRAAPA
jgi:hypothetical protein